MRRLCVGLVALALGVLAMAQVSPASLEGRWWLAMLEEASLPLNLTFRDDDGSGVRPYLYSPAQAREALGVSKWSLVNDTLKYTDKKTGVRLTLVWSEQDSSFDGSFRQGMLRAHLHFVPSDGMFSLLRPQTPQPPFPYREREVTIERRKAGVTLSGTLTIPAGSAPKGGWPAVVLVSGSGQQNRDEEIFFHKPFAVLADRLAHEGIAVLRYDDRGVGGSKGEVANATTLDFADDAEAVFDFLRRQKEVNGKRVGIVGHSEGGMIAPIVASHNPKVCFVVLLAGPGTTGAEVLEQQIRRIMQLTGVPEPLTDIRIESMRRFFEAMDTLPVDDYSNYYVSICEEMTRGLDDEERKQAEMRKGDAMAMAMQMATPWMRTFVALDNGEYLAKTRCAVLAIGGTLDCQVVPENLDAIVKATDGKATTVKMEGLNHLMQHCTTGLPSEYAMIEETMSDEVIDCIVRWIKERQ